MQASATGPEDTVSSTMPASALIALLSKRRCPNITEQLDLERCGRAPISGGGFGDIYQGALSGGTQVAIKCARLYIQQDDKDGHKVLKHAARELYAWSRFKHENVLELFGLAQFRDQMAMISPWMDNGTLLQYIKRTPAANRYNLCTGISEGVAYLHQNGTIHGDIKSGNVLISSEGVAKLADFGCTELRRGSLYFTTTTSDSQFSMRWAAPEILDGPVTRSKEADVYALGMTLLEAITGSAPFNDKHDMAVYVTVAVKKQIPERPNEFPSFDGNEADQLWKIMVESWAYNPSDRPGSAVIRDSLKGIKQRAVPTPRSIVPPTVPKRAINRKATYATKRGLVDDNRLKDEFKQLEAQLRDPVISRAEVDSESETEMARWGLTNVIDYDLDEPGQLWVHSVPQEVVGSVSGTEKKRQEAINKVIQTERDFVRDLEYLRDSWMAPLKTEEIISADRRMDFMQQVFWSIEDIIDVNTRLRDLLTRRQKAYPIVETIGDIFLELVPHFGSFVQYSEHQPYGKCEFEKEKASNPTFAAFVEAVERLPASRELGLNGYLTKPATRLAWYPLLLEVVLRHTPEDNVDRVAIPKVIKLVRELLGKMNEVSMKRLSLLRLDRVLVFGQELGMDLELKDEQRQLVYKGSLKRRGVAANENGDLQIFLFDHALLVAESKMVNEREQLNVFRRPIPLRLLVVSIPKENAARESRPRTTNPNGLATANGIPPPTTPARPGLQKSECGLTVSHIGKHGYSLVLWAPTVVARRKWVKHITAQQEVMRERSMVFDTFMLGEDVFVGDAKMNCAVPYDMGRRIAYGTDVGVYSQALGEGKNGTPVKVLDLADVQQIDVLEEYQLLIVLAKRSVLTFPLDVLESPDPTSSLKRMKRISSHTSFFKAGRCLGRTLVCVVKASSLSSTIKTFEPIDQNVRRKNKSTFRKLLQGGNDTLKVFKELYIPTESHSIHFLNTKLFVACTKGFEVVNLETLDTQVLLDPADASLDFMQHRGTVRPLSMYQIDGEFLLCYTEFAFYVNKSGRRSKRDVTIYWEGTPTAFAFHYPYVMAFDPTFIEIRHVEDGGLVQVIRGNNLRCLFADTQPFVTNSPTTSPSNSIRPRRSHDRDEIILLLDNKVMAARPAVPPSRASDAPVPKA